MIKLTIPGSIPSKKNSRMLFKRHGRQYNLPNKDYREWHERCRLLLFGTQSVSSVKTVEIEFYLKDNRRRDLTNMAESIMDLLVDCGIIHDDCWQNIPRILLHAAGIRKDNPTAEVTIIY